MTKHAELIARLEAAEVGSRELDVCMWEASDGWQNVHRPPCVTTSLDAALALAERVGLDPLEALEAVVKMRHPLVEQLPRSCCIAILKALEAKQ